MRVKNAINKFSQEIEEKTIAHEFLYDTIQSLLQLTFFEIGTPEKSYLLSGLKILDILKFLFKSHLFFFREKIFAKT